MANKYTVQWEAEDGYCGGARPQSFKVWVDDFDADQTLEEITKQLADTMQEDFAQKVYPAGKNLDEVAQQIYSDLQREKEEDAE